MTNKLNNLSYLKSRRKELRNNSTSAEAALWNLLKGSQLEGYKFRRQHSIGNYIVDFYCAKKKLAVELDGQIHFETAQAIKDGERAKFLNEKGITVIRIENKNVFSNTSAVLDYILQHLK